MSRTLAVLVAFGLMPGSMLPPPASRVEPGSRRTPPASSLRRRPSAHDRRPALFVAGSTTLGAGDLAVKARLEALGFEVNVRSASSVQSGEAYDHNLVVVSSTVSPGSVNTKFRDVEKPVLTWEREIFDDMKMTGTSSGTHHGTDTNETKVTISASSASAGRGADWRTDGHDQPADLRMGRTPRHRDQGRDHLQRPGSFCRIRVRGGRGHGRA